MNTKSIIKTTIEALKEIGLVKMILWFVKLKKETDTRLFDPDCNHYLD